MRHLLMSELLLERGSLVVECVVECVYLWLIGVLLSYLIRGLVRCLLLYHTWKGYPALGGSEIVLRYSGMVCTLNIRKAVY